MACKLALKSLVNDNLSFLRPHQLGLGVPNGAEAIVHSIAATMDCLQADESILQIDFTNAFNLVSRSKILELVCEHFPQMLNLVHYLYSNQGILKVGQDNLSLKSCAGIQQGCPLAPFLFSIVLRVLVIHLHNTLPDLRINLWYLDDGHLAGKTSDLLRCLDIIRVLGPSLGLHVNMGKCAAFGFDLSSYPDDIIRASDGLMVLGAPVGSPEYVALKVNEKVCAAILTLFKSRAIEDPQKELLLLRCCTGSVKMTYWLRTCVPTVIANQVAIFDLAVDDALQHIIGNPVFGEDRHVIHLPLSKGGLGISISALISNAAFVASVGASWSLQVNSSPRSGYHDAVLHLTSHGTDVPQLNLMSSAIPLNNTAKEFSQTKFMLAHNSMLREKLMMSADVKKRVILDGRSCKGANYWLTSIPCRWENSEFDPASFRALLKYSIGMPLMPECQKCPDCGKPQDNLGHHALSCKIACGSIDRHNSIVRGISLILQKAKVNHRVEEPNPASSSQKRPGDIFMPDFDILGDAYFDVSVINICSDAYYKKAAKGQFEGSNIRYQSKMKKYPELGHHLKPLVVESTGGWHQYSFGFLKTLASHVAARLGSLTKDVLNNILSTSSIRLQRHQGSLLVRRCLGF